MHKKGTKEKFYIWGFFLVSVTILFWKQPFHEMTENLGSWMVVVAVRLFNLA